jgi:hypothetical protein
MQANMDHSTGLVFFISAFVILSAGLVMVAGKRVSRRYLVYRIVPLAGFFGAFGLAALVDSPGGYFGQAALACVQTGAILVILHLLVGRHLKG